MNANQPLMYSTIYIVLDQHIQLIKENVQADKANIYFQILTNQTHYAWI